MTRPQIDTATFILNAGHKGLVLRLFTAFAWIAGAALLAISSWLAVSLSDLDGNFEPLSARLFLAGICAAVGLLCTVGMWIYLRLYPTQIARSGNIVILEFPRVIGTRSVAVPIASLSGGTRHTGRSNPYSNRVRVNAPYMTVRMDGWHLPLVIDLKSDYLDEAALTRLLKDAKKAQAKTASQFT